MLNMDFSQRVVIDTRNRDWITSPQPGVWRKPLARAGAERGHATSLVRYQPGASFSGHDHPQGEEILVLEGVFSDHTGDYPTGTYLRNPPGFFHAPQSREGCLLLVKLHQFQSDDYRHCALATHGRRWQHPHNRHRNLLLHRHRGETVSLQHWPAGLHPPPYTADGGEEIFVIAGEWGDEAGRYASGCWIRNPPGTAHRPFVDRDTLLWVKSGHLSAQRR